MPARSRLSKIFLNFQVTLLSICCKANVPADITYVVPFQEKQTKDALTRKQLKGKKKGGQEEESHEATELLKRPKEYTVKFTFPNPPPLSPPILGLHSKNMCTCSEHSVYSLWFPAVQEMFQDKRHVNISNMKPSLLWSEHPETKFLFYFLFKAIK